MLSSHKPYRADSGIQPFKVLFESARSAKRLSLEDLPAGKRAKMMSDGTTAGKVSGSQLARELRDKAERERQARAAEDKGATGQGAVTVRASASALLVAVCTASCRGCKGVVATTLRRPQMVCMVLASTFCTLHLKLAQLQRTGAHGAGPLNCLHLGCTVPTLQCFNQSDAAASYLWLHGDPGQLPCCVPQYEALS